MDHTELDKSRPHGQRKPLGGALFPTDVAHSAPAELQPLVQLQITLSKAQLAIRPALDPANKAYAALTTGTTPLPSPPLYAGRLSSLAKDLVNAEAAVAETLKTRKELIASLEKLLHSNRAALPDEERQLADVRARRTEVESKKRDIDDAIMRGVSTSQDLNNASRDHSDFHLGQRPEIERFTPPPPSPVPAAATLPEQPTVHAGYPQPTVAPLSEHSNHEPRVTAEDLQRSTTPPGMPPSYQYGRGQNGSFFQGDGTTTPEEVLPPDEDDIYGNEAADRFLETLTPPPAPMPEAAAFEPVAPTIPTLTKGKPQTCMPGISVPSTNGIGSVDPRKRPSSALNTSSDPRRRSGVQASPAKRRRTSEDEFDGLPGLGGEGGLEGLDKEVVGMLGS